jgi:3-oxosteroid 1-dehydrogenase
MGHELGAGLGFIDEAWWMTVTLVPGVETPYMVLVDRTLPGSIMVNKKGRRFTNEAGPYIDVVKDQYVTHSEAFNAIPAFLIADHRFHKKYPLGALMSWSSPKKYIANGFIKAADTLEALATKCGIDPQGLKAEVEKFNRYAKTGKDPDFKRGEKAIDRYYSDPSVKPNPCLAPLDKPPFYAMEIFPGDLGTKGGLATDAHARVLREDGTPINGLYATGNCSSPVMGATYPGAGGTIGPSMTFGYIAARNAVGD